MVDLFLTICALRTRTFKSIDKISACSTMQTRVTVTFIKFQLTILPSESWNTCATVFINLIHTSSIVLTRGWLAIINICLTVSASKASCTRACIVCNIIKASCTIETGVIRTTVINICFTIGTTVAKKTSTIVCSY